MSSKTTEQGKIKKSRKVFILVGLILLEIAAVVYDAVFNEYRVIKPIDTATYTFRATDLSLLAVTALFAVYVLYIVIAAVVHQWRHKSSAANVTRRLDPRFGWFGFFGFFGFLGVPAYMMQQQVWPFFFFVFFGFFGFFYEGKLSSTLIDERFQEEQSRAQLKAYKTGFGLLWAVTWLTGITGSHLTASSVAIIYSVASSLIIALVLFMSNYLLYKYDTEGLE